MFWMLLFILSSVAFNHTLRYANSRKRNTAWIGVVTYIAATLFFGAWWAVQRAGLPEASAIALGVISGATAVAQYYVLVWAIRLAGVAITQTIGRLSVIVPILVAMAIWQEIPGTTRMLGLVLAFGSLPLLSGGDAVRIHSTHRRTRLIALLIFFAVTGARGIVLKLTAIHVPHEHYVGFLCLMFASAAVGTGVVAARQTVRLRAAEVFHGAALGGINVISNYALIVALAAYPAWIVFPTTSAATIALSAAAATVLWRERLGRRAIAGIAIAIMAIVLINVDLGKILDALKG